MSTWCHVFARATANFAPLMLALSVAAGSALASEPQVRSLGTLALVGLDHRTHRLDEWSGKFRIVNLWATWCAPCLREIPELNAIAKDWAARDVVVVGIATDGEADVRDSVAAGRAEYPVLIAAEGLPELLRITNNRGGSVPFTLLLDKQGNVLKRHAGPIDQSTIAQWLSHRVAPR